MSTSYYSNNTLKRISNINLQAFPTKLQTLNSSKTILVSNVIENRVNKNFISTIDFLNILQQKNSMNNVDKLKVDKKQDISLEKLSYKPSQFIDVMWNHFEKVIKNDNPSEIIEFFKNKEVKNRISGELNPEMKEFIQSQAPKDEVCFEYQNLLINEPQDIQSKKEFINHIADNFTQYLGLGHMDIIYEEKRLGEKICNNPNKNQDKSNNGQILGAYNFLQDNVIINVGAMANLKGNELLNTITHELTHAKQAKNMKAYLSYMNTPNFIKSLKLQNVRCTPGFNPHNLSKNDKIMLLSNIMGIIQQNENLCDYRFYNHELEAFAVGNKVSGQIIKPFKNSINLNS